MITDKLPDYRIGSTPLTLRANNPSYSYCVCCGVPWSHTKGRTVMIKDGIGLFAVCKLCWNDLTIDSRVTFYKALVISQGILYPESTGRYTVDEVEAAVRKESL